MSFAAAVLLTAALSAETTAKIDKVFHDYDHSNTPGCAIAIVRGGAVAYERGYGMADLERDVVITPESRFDTGSVAKQFTAAAVLQLVDEGKLSLDDDIRKYVPEVPDYGTKITLRNLLHHTSGLRDTGELLYAHGFALEDLVLDRDGLQLLARQKSLNFPPGSEYRYCNTGYWLLSIVVTRVSGMPFRDFVRTHVFEPAGMTHTDIRDDQARLFRNRAMGYDSAKSGFVIEMTNWVGPGDTGVITSVDDLAKWLINGQQRFIQPLLRRDPLTTGEIPTYAFGFLLGERDGHRRIEHGGSTGGYRTHVMMLPDDDLSVAVMCNMGNANTTALADGAVDAILGEVPVRRAENVPQNIDGMYVDPTTSSIVRVTTKDGKTTISGAPLRGGADGRYRVGLSRVVEFHPGSLDIADSGSIAHHYVVATPPKPATSALAGRYHSDEVAADWIVTFRDGKLFVTSDRIDEVELKPLYENGYQFSTQFALFVMDFSRDAFTISDRGVTHLRFTRVR